MLDNFYTDEDESRNHSDTVLKTSEENTVDRKSMYRESLKKNENEKKKYTYNQNERMEISENLNEEGQFGKYNTHRAY